jgi:hypothetical protein
MTSIENPAGHLSASTLHTLTLREAVVTVLAAAAAADGVPTAVEAPRLNALLGSMRLYHTVPQEHRAHLVRRALDMVAEMEGRSLLDACAVSIPGHLRLPVFAVAVELVMVDGAIGQSGRQFVRALHEVLDIDAKAAASVVDVLLLKSRA